MKQHKPNLPRSVRKQAGGTFLGLILGLIVGLGIAVVVALMITKSPIPFVNKVTKQDRTELSPGQASDPNKPLYGNKDSGRDVNADKSADQSALPPAAMVKKPDVATAPPKNADTSRDQSKMASSGSNTASNSSVAGAANGQAAAGSPADDKWSYFLQTGAFREQADAESARAKLALLGFEAKVSDRSSDNGTLYRVRIGPISQSETVNRMRSKLSDNGIDAAVVRIAK